MYVGTKTRGMGATPAQIVGTGFQLGTPVATAGIATGLSTTTVTGGVASTTILGLAPALAVPIIGAALAGVSILAMKLIQNSGCGPTCIQASDYANQAEPILRNNLNTYLALPKPRSQSQQAAALETFDRVWSQLVQLWSDPKLGNAGKRGISDRQAGACKWRDASGACWNWFSGYRDPIANDPNVVPDSQAALSSAVGALLPGGGSVSTLGLLALAGLVIAGVYFL